jgi:hypothetical protein
VLAAALAVLLPAGVLVGCGGDDNPIPPTAESRPIGETPEPTPTAVSASEDGDDDENGDDAASAAPSATPTAPGGVLVQGNGITFRMPGQPERLSQTGGSGSTRIQFDIFRYEGETEVYSVTRGYYPKIGTLPTLKEAIEESADQAGGKLATSRTFKYKKMPAIEGVISGVKDKGEEVTIFARYVVVDRVMYGLLFLDRGGADAPPGAFLTFVESVEFTS